MTGPEMYLPPRLYTWIDVESTMSSLLADGRWPAWLLECDAFWDGVELTVDAETSQTEIVGWLREAFGSGSVTLNGSSVGLLMDSGPRSQEVRLLPIEVIERAAPIQVRREPRWREQRIVADMAKPMPQPCAELPEAVNVVALHSYKGGVGRTLHGIALALAAAKHQKVLLVDADLEAPGISWLFEKEGKRTDFAYEDFLALLHGSPDDSADEAIRIAASYLPNQSLSRVVVMPARRDLNRITPPRIEPADLLTPGRDPYYLTNSLANLAVAVGAGTVIVDLRAGMSELSASILLDSRVQRVFVSTVSSQSIDGTVNTIRALSSRSPGTSNTPSPQLVLTQYRSQGHEDLLADSVAKLKSSMLGLLPANDIDYESKPLPDDDIQEDLALSPILSEFQENLLGLPPSWRQVISSVADAGLPKLFRELVTDLDERVLVNDEHNNAPRPVPSSLTEHRRALSEFASRLAFAEHAEVQHLLPTKSLRSLLESHRTESPICVVAGAKGAGKTFTQLQMSFRRTWQNYAKAVHVDGVAFDSALVPVLVSSSLGGEALKMVDEIRNSSVASVGQVPATRLQLKELISDGVSRGLSDKEWRLCWLSCLARSIGLDANFANVEDALINFAASGESRIFLIDGLEDILQEIATNPDQQRALRVLLTDCLDWLRSMRGRPLGLIVFVRRDLVQSAIKQNSGQLLSLYRDYDLAWDPDEATRLALWVASGAKALEDLNEDDIVNAEGSELTQHLHAVWGEKMGTANSRQARSRGWFLAALSDFNRQIQARDIVTFVGQAAKDSIDDARYADRLLVPSAMRSALPVCSKQKIQAIGEETPLIGQTLTKLRQLPADKKQLPFVQQDVGLEPVEIEILSANGILFREDDEYWIPEIFRHGIGFKATGRPRVLAIADLVRKRNNMS